jgi:outer membrane protein
MPVSGVFAQKVAFISSDMIREKFPEAKQAQQRIQSMVEDWKRELKFMQQKIENLQFDIKKNRLIWTDQERATKEKELEDQLKMREDFAKSKFEPGGEYDKVTYEIMKPIEEKIHASVQQVAADVGVDIIFDQSTQPLAYVNYKYDLTLRVLRKLGVDVEQLEADLQEKIKQDPRNERRKSKTPRRGRRSRNDPNEEVQKEQPEEENEREFEQNNNDPKPLNPDEFPEKIEPERK